MSLRDEVKATTAQFKVLSLYQRFEHAVILILTALIAIVVVVAVWNLILKVVVGLVSWAASTCRSIRHSRRCSA